MEHIIHTLAPVFNRQSKILILGTLPSVKSRETSFYYGHPQNRFWKLLSGLLNAPVPASVEEKKGFLFMSRIAIWDVIKSCDIEGSSDSSIKNVTPNDLLQITSLAPIEYIYANGSKAYELFEKYMKCQTSLPVRKLPSTSPANAAYSLERLKMEWSPILQVLAQS